MTNTIKPTFPVFQKADIPELRKPFVDRYTAVFTGKVPIEKSPAIGLKLYYAVKKANDKYGRIMAIRELKASRPCPGYASFDPKTGNPYQIGVIVYMPEKEDNTEYLELLSEYLHYELNDEPLGAEE